MKYKNYFQVSKLKQSVLEVMHTIYGKYPFLAPNTRFFKRSVAPNASVLDLGCGMGHTIRFFKSIHSDCQIYALDIEEAANVPHELICDFKKHDINTSPLPYEDNFFDFINCQHVLEHLTNPFEVLTECRRVLKPGGTLYVEVPDVRWTLLPHLPLICSHKGVFNFWDDPTHIRPYSQQALSRLAVMSGFSGEMKTFYVRKWAHLLALPMAIFSRDDDYKVAFLHPLLGLWCGILAKK